MPAILFGSISTVADTSERQRQAFNQAFAEHGLPWQWDQAEYRTMLARSGGAGRIAEYAHTRGQSVDAKAIHQTKSQIFQANLAQRPLSPRAGVLDTISGAKKKGWKIGLVTTTSAENVSALLAALSPDVQAGDFDVIVDASRVDTPKPDAAAYLYALANLGEQPGDCVAIEDNSDGVQSAVAAGLVCVAFPNENTVHNDITGVQLNVERLDVEQLQQLTGSR